MNTPIKDNQGDWGICTAAWKGMVPGKPGTPGTRGRRGVRGVPGKPGYFKMNFVNLRQNFTESVTLPKGGISNKQYRKGIFEKKSITHSLRQAYEYGTEYNLSRLKIVCVIAT